MSAEQALMSSSRSGTSSSSYSVRRSEPAGSIGRRGLNLGSWNACATVVRRRKARAAAMLGSVLGLLASVRFGGGALARAPCLRFPASRRPHCLCRRCQVRCRLRRSLRPTSRRPTSRRPTSRFRPSSRRRRPRRAVRGQRDARAGVLHGRLAVRDGAPESSSGSRAPARGEGRGRVTSVETRPPRKTRGDDHRGRRFATG